MRSPCDGCTTLLQAARRSYRWWRPPSSLNRKNGAHFGRLHRAGLRTILLERQMRACLMIISEISLEVVLQAAFIEYDHVIQAVPANAADQSLDIRPLPRRTRSRQHLLDSHDFHLFYKLMALRCARDRATNIAVHSPTERLPEAGKQSTRPLDAL